MTPESFIQNKASEAIKAIYGTEVAETSLQVSVTRKEFEGDYTLVTFPLLKITRQAPDVTGNAIGEWLVSNVPEISAFNSVKGFLNLSFSPVYWNESLKAIAEALESLDEAHKAKSLSSVPQLFTEYKRNELVSIFSGKDDNATRERIYDILFAIDASQNTEWQKIKK